MKYIFSIAICFFLQSEFIHAQLPYHFNLKVAPWEYRFLDDGNFLVQFITSAKDLQKKSTYLFDANGQLLLNNKKSHSMQLVNESTGVFYSLTMESDNKIILNRSGKDLRVTSFPLKGLLNYTELILMSFDENKNPYWILAGFKRKLDNYRVYMQMSFDEATQKAECILIDQSELDHLQDNEKEPICVGLFDQKPVFMNFVNQKARNYVLENKKMILIDELDYDPKLAANHSRAHSFKNINYSQKDQDPSIIYPILQKTDNVQINQLVGFILQTTDQDGKVLINTYYPEDLHVQIKGNTKNLHISGYRISDKKYRVKFSADNQSITIGINPYTDTDPKTIQETYVSQWNGISYEAMPEEHKQKIIQTLTELNLLNDHYKHKVCSGTTSTGEWKSLIFQFENRKAILVKMIKD